MDTFCLQKGVEYALDHICDSPIFVVAGISKRIHDGWSHSYPAGHCHHRIRGRLIQGRKIFEGFGLFAEKVRYWARRWSARQKSFSRILGSFEGILRTGGEKYGNNNYSLEG